MENVNGGMNVSHKYEKAGSYQIVLTVIDDGGVEAQTQTTVVVMPEAEKSHPGCGCGR